MDAPGSVRLTNDDFRRLLMTPHHASGSNVGTASAVSSISAGNSERNASLPEVFATPKTPAFVKGSGLSKKDASSKNENKKRKKSVYSLLKREEEQKLAELADKYRDRAKERRENADAAPTAAVPVSVTAYKAVAPDVRFNLNMSDRRRRLIQESKYLGGDIEHTHLVKGLDYALLEKIRLEAEQKQLEEAKLGEHRKRKKKTNRAEDDDGDGDGHGHGHGDDDDDDNCSHDSDVENGEFESCGSRVDTIGKDGRGGHNNDEADSDTDIRRNKQSNLRGSIPVIKFRTIMTKNLYNILSAKKSNKVEQNELFLPGRMAYVIDLEEENETDIPTTLVRSKLDVPSLEANQSVSTNDIVVNKLVDIFAYLRQSSKKTNKKVSKKLPCNSESAKSHSHSRSGRDRSAERSENRRKSHSRSNDYADRECRSSEYGRSHGSGQRREPHSRKSSNVVDSIYDDIGEYKPNLATTSTSSSSTTSSYRRLAQGAEKVHFPESAEEKEAKEADMKREKALKMARLIQQPDSYVECYPGFEEMKDAIDDSDEEVDFSKMDMGSKKGPVGRWDFDTAEEYSDYMDKVEAMPKAAFQYGVKMSDGRKSRKNPKHNRNELDKEWAKIQNMLNKGGHVETKVAPSSASAFLAAPPPKKLKMSSK